MIVEFPEPWVLRHTGRWKGGRPVVDHATHMAYFVDGVRHDIPAGSISDLASIPWLLWWLISPWGPIIYSALAHDDIYGNHRNYTRLDADRIFLAGMKTMKVGWRRWPAYWAVRLFGRWAWK